MTHLEKIKERLLADIEKIDLSKIDEQWRDTYIAHRRKEVEQFMGSIDPSYAQNGGHGLVWLANSFNLQSLHSPQQGTYHHQCALSASMLLYLSEVVNLREEV